MLPVFDQTGQCFDFQPVNKNIKNNSFDLVLKKNTKSGLQPKINAYLHGNLTLTRQ